MKQKGIIITGIILLAAVLASYYASEHIGVYLIKKPTPVFWAIIEHVTSIILLPGFYLFLVIGGSVHAGINTISEKAALILGSWFAWTSLVLVVMQLVRVIGDRLKKL